MNLLWIGDGLISNSVSRVAHAILDVFPAGWDITMFAYTHDQPWRDPCCHGYRVVRYDGSRGQGTLLLRSTRPDIVCFFGGPTGAVAAADTLRGIAALGLAPDRRPLTFCYQPLEVENLSRGIAALLQGFDRVIVPAEFCAAQFFAAGLTPKPEVIGHGIDRRVFYPVPKAHARRALGLPPNGYVVGCVNGNFRRKRIDLALRYFALWARNKHPDVKFYYHGLPNTRNGWDVRQLSQYYGVEDRLILTPALVAGSFVDDDYLRNVYNAMDVHISTSFGEGFGLTVAESMACGVPQIVPEHSALADWPRGAVHFVPCTSTYTAAYGEDDGQNCIGHVADQRLFCDALERLYVDAAYRRGLATLACERTSEDRFRWDRVAGNFARLFEKSTLALRRRKSDGLPRARDPRLMRATDAALSTHSLDARVSHGS